jgi:RNA ligase (TIGR02306 family)
MNEIVRKLATIEKILDLRPIEGADKIEICQIRGWEVVVQKGLYNVNDLVVFFEIDSFLPIAPVYEFLRKSSYRVTKDLGEGFRVKTIKLRGQISQGLVFPIAELEGLRHAPRYEGEDVTELLGVRKWEPNQQTLLSGDVEGAFPSFIPKTDEERVQNLSGRQRREHEHDEFLVTIKYDGSSVTAFHNEGHVGICSRNWEQKEDGGSLYWKVASDVGLVRVLNKIDRNIAFQGELVGPGVQGNPYKYEEHKIVMFNIYDIDAQKYLDPYDAFEFIRAINVIFNLRLEYAYTMFYSIKGIVSDKETLDGIVYDTGKINGQDIEGIVLKSLTSPGFSYKYINPTYLLKDKD